MTTVYNAGSINGAESVAEIYGVEIESIEEVNQVKVEHVPLDTVIYYHGTITDPTTRSDDLASYGLDGWYVCNGKKSGAPDLIDVTKSFLLGSATAGSSGGDDVRSIITHTHTCDSEGGHTWATHTCTVELDHYHDTQPYFINRVHYGHLVATYMGLTRLTSTNSNHTHTCTSSGAHDHSGTYGHTIGNSGSASPNNRPVYRTLIPIIRLDRVQFEFVVGCVLWYDANDIGSPSSRSTDLSGYGLPGWYVCNNQSTIDGNTLDMQDRFVRCEYPSDTAGGTDTAVNAQHNHELSELGSHSHTPVSVDHDHEVPKQYSEKVWAVGYGGTSNNLPTGIFGAYDHTTDTEPDHNHTLESYANTHDHGTPSANSGAGNSDNRPAFYSMLLIERLS